PASPGPLTAQPSTATSKCCGYSCSRSSTRSASIWTPTLSRPHDGHAIITGPRSRRPSALRISNATLTSSTGSAGSGTPPASPPPAASNGALPTPPLVRPPEGGPPSGPPAGGGDGRLL